MTNILKGLFATFFLISLAACMTVPVSGRHALNAIPEGVEVSLGKQQYASTLSQEPISHDQRINEIVRRVGSRIAAVANKPDYEWEYTVVEKNIMNAFCLPGGKIVVYRGILPLAKNEAGLATVLSHEIAHALARHGGQRMTAQVGMVAGMLTLQRVALKNNPRAPYILAALGLGSQVGIMLPYSRAQEAEADEIGQILMARAGYDPAESVRFWSRFAQVAHSGVPTLFSDHPSDASREEDLRNRLPQAQAEYAKASAHYGLGESF